MLIIMLKDSDNNLYKDVRIASSPQFPRPKKPDKTMVFSFVSFFVLERKNAVIEKYNATAFLRARSSPKTADFLILNVVFKRVAKGFDSFLIK